MTQTQDYDSTAYLIYGRKEMRIKALLDLSGFLHGIIADGCVDEEEMAELERLVALTKEFCSKPPFSTVISTLEDMLSEHAIDKDEIEDIAWLADHLSCWTETDDLIKSSLQLLDGYIHGILADNTLEEQEILALQRWLSDHRFLAGYFPYDELIDLVEEVLRDGVITAERKEKLAGFISQFVDFSQSATLSEEHYRALREKYDISAIEAKNPAVRLSGQCFALTGEFSSGSRAEIENLITSSGGIVKKGISKKIDYLVVGELGNPCWSFTTYGRKIEQALNLRKAGHPILIIGESTLLQALNAPVQPETEGTGA
mgnify:CR=1 FL=1